MKNKILAVDNEVRMCKLIKASLELDNYLVDTAFSGSEALDKLNQNRYDVVVTDLKMDTVDGLQVLTFTRQNYPETEVILITAFATQETALEAIKKGAYDYLIKPFKIDELSLRIERILKQKTLEQENKKLKAQSIQPQSFPGIVGKSTKMREVFRKIEQVSPVATSVQIRGESGTGKELVAHAIHRLSPRKDKPFIAINCAALPENLLESELFGYEKGAFTGAVQKREGLFEQANGGTVFLDEIGDMPLLLQAKLLRVLQSNEITHLGGQKTIPVDFRLITATHCDLEEMLEEKLFRQDLYYRINIFPLYLPPLRERKEDIPELIQFFLNEYPDKTLSKKARQQLIEYDYPGNVRELENIISRAVLLADDIIEDIPLNANNESKPLSSSALLSDLPDTGFNLDEFEKKLILRAIEKADGNKNQAAQILGITRRRLYSMIERFGITT